MEQNSVLKSIALETENLNAHIRRLSKPGHQLHALDLDLMLEKVRHIYDEIFQLYAFAPKPVVDHYAQKDPEISILFSRETEVVVKSLETEKPKLAQAPIDKPVEVVQQLETPKPPVTTTPMPGAVNVPPPAVDAESNEIADVAETNADVHKTQLELTRQQGKTTLDLFAEAAADSLGDKLGNDDDSSIAARMSKAKISDLRSAIGINDKFLFINDLFKGNMQQYNRILDELNAFKSLNGANTYLIELKVEHQWDVDSAAFQKLKGFIERRFGA
ncbi:MAG: hypothetical protein KGZ82_07445 [Bacteroidales bacterium]|nr:hypothetical protein [Bacteroidales bacterium]